MKSAADPRSILLFLRTRLHRETGLQPLMEWRAQMCTTRRCRINPRQKWRKKQVLGPEQGRRCGHDRNPELSQAPRDAGAGAARLTAQLRLRNHLKPFIHFAATAAASGALFPLEARDRGPGAAARSNMSRNRRESCSGRAKTGVAAQSSAEGAGEPDSMPRIQAKSCGMGELGSRRQGGDELIKTGRSTPSPHTGSLPPAPRAHASREMLARGGAAQGKARVTAVTSSSS